MTDPTADNSEMETDFEVGQDNNDRPLGPLGLDIQNPVFAISGLQAVAFAPLTPNFPGTGGAGGPRGRAPLVVRAGSVG